MCTFLSQLPKKSKSNGTGQRKSMVLSLKTCPDVEGKPSWYRVRLLAWSSPEKNDRDDPFIERYVHQIWKKNEKGFSVIDDEVVCPVTKYVHIDGNRYDACPMCKLANQYFGAWKSSNWKDRDAAKKNNELGRKYQGIIPIYVVDDPNYPQNKGTFKVLIFNDKQFYSEFRSKVEKASQTNCVFNGKNAVDCCIHVAEVEEVRNEGQPNEYVFKKKVIDRITFTTKPYDIPTITKEWVINSGFDEEYYVSSTPEELQRFYNRHYKVSNDDIPEEDMMQVYETKQIKTESTNNIVAVENSNINLNTDISDNDLDDLTDNIISSEIIEQNSNVETSNNTDAPVESVEDLLAGLDI